MITIGQIKAARAFLGLTQAELARKAGIGQATLNNLERDIATPHRSTLQVIQTALEKEGIEFIDDTAPSPTGGPGLRLKE